MNTIERLLKLDSGKIQLPTKEVTLKLKKIGETFTFPCKAVDAEYVAELQENSIQFKKGELAGIKTYDTKVLTIIEGCPDVFKNKDLIKHFGVITPKELVKKLLVSGEMDELKSEIDKLGGYDADEVEEVKN